MATSQDPRAELLDTAARLRHLRGEHTRSGADGGVRRKLDAELKDLWDHLERRLSRVVDDEPDREAWRAHARGAGPAPDRPEEGEGVSEEGSSRPDRPSGRRPWPR